MVPRTFVAHAHLLHYIEVTVVVPFRDLLVIYDQDQAHCEYDVEEDADKQQAAVHRRVAPAPGTVYDADGPAAARTRLARLA